MKCYSPPNLDEKLNQILRNQIKQMAALVYLRTGYFNPANSEEKAINDLIIAIGDTNRVLK